MIKVSLLATIRFRLSNWLSKYQYLYFIESSISGGGRVVVVVVVVLVAVW